MPGSGRGRDQGTHAPDRRARRHEETRSQILDLAVAIMTDDGVAGLSMASLARALSIQPPSLYKYFPSRMAVYDELFRRGQLANLEALRSGMRGAAPGMDAVAGGMEAAGRWAGKSTGDAVWLDWNKASASTMFASLIPELHGWCSTMCRSHCLRVRWWRSWAQGCR